ncbi:MAG: MFS transporter [Patescibacteria group bacterium]
MLSAKISFSRSATTFTPFWFYIVLHKFGAGIHYAMIAVLGAQIFPLWAVGLCVSFASFIEFALDIPAGFVLERYGYLKMLRITTLFFCVAGGALLFGLSPLTYFISLTFGGLGWLFFTPGINAYLLANAPLSIFGRLYGVLRASEGAGIMLATLCLPLLVRLPVPMLGLVMIYPLLGAIVALVIGGHYRMPNTLPHTVKAKRQVREVGMQKVLGAFRALHPVGTALAIYMTCLSTFFGAIWFVFPILVNAGTKPTIISTSMSVLEFAMVVAGFTISRLADSKRKKVIVLVSMLVIMTTGALIGFTLHPILILLCFIFSFADELLRTTLWAWLDTKAKAAGREEHGIVSGAITFADDLGWMIGPAAAGVLFATVGAQPTIRIMSVVVVGVGVLTLALLLRRTVSVTR